MNQIVEASCAKIARLCKKAWEEQPSEPDLWITFQSGGLFALGHFQKISGFKKPVIALPWSRRQVKGKKFIVDGPAIHTIAPIKLLRRAKVIAIVDDIFDNGATLQRALVELAELKLSRCLVVNCYAPYLKTCLRLDLLRVTPLCIQVIVGELVSEDQWIKFYWEKGL